MNAQCLTMVNKDQLRFLKMMIKSTPYAQERWGVKPIVFTDDAVSYISSLVNAFGEEIRTELCSSYFYPTQEMQDRLNKIIGEDYNPGDAINFLGEYSDFVYYGYINSLTKSETLKVFYPDYVNSSETYLNTAIKEFIKSIRKEFLNMDINYRGHPVKPNDVTMSRIGFIVSSNADGNKKFPYRFEDGTFADLTLTELKEIQMSVITYMQRIMATEDESIKYFLSLSVEDKHELVDYGVVKIKEYFDNVVKDKKW